MEVVVKLLVGLFEVYSSERWCIKPSYQRFYEESLAWNISTKTQVNGLLHEEDMVAVLNSRLTFLL